MTHLDWSVLTVLTEKILTFSSELKMFLKTEGHFNVEIVFILLESSWIGGI